MKGAKSKVVVISGASAGIGQACAALYAQNGAHLVLGARRLGKLEEEKPGLLKSGAASVECFELDVASKESVAHFAHATFKVHSTVDILVNNAGLALGVDPVSVGQEENWAQMLDVNVLGALRFIRAFLPTMMEKDSGHIVNMGSIAGEQVYAGGAVYAATKHALRAISQTLRLELNGTPIRVTSIDPGMVETEFSIVRLGDEAKAKSVYKNMTPLTPEDIAETILFATSRPAHVNIDRITIMPTDQAAVYKVHRKS